MYHVSAQGIAEHVINIHYYYYFMLADFVTVMCIFHTDWLNL